MKNILSILILACFFFFPHFAQARPATVEFEPELSREAVVQMKQTKGFWLEVQVPQRLLAFAKGGTIIKTFPVAVGMPDYPIPQGWRSINQIIWNPWWRPPPKSKWVDDATPVAPRSDENPLGEIKMPVGDTYLIHGTRAANSIGHWASHGCIRMRFTDIFGLVQLVLAKFSATSAVDEMEKANRDKSQEFTTGLKGTLPVYFSYNTVKVYKNLITIAPDVYHREDDRTQKVFEAIAPYLAAENKKPSEKKISGVLKMVNDQTIGVAMKDLAE